MERVRNTAYFTHMYLKLRYAQLCFWFIRYLPSCTAKLVTSPLEGATSSDRVSMYFRRAPQV